MLGKGVNLVLFCFVFLTGHLISLVEHDKLCFWVTKGNFWTDYMISKQTKMTVRLGNQA